MTDHFDFTRSLLRHCAHDIPRRRSAILRNLLLAHLESLFVKLIEAVELTDALGIGFPFVVEVRSNVLGVPISSIAEVVDQGFVVGLLIINLLLSVVVQVFV